MEMQLLFNKYYVFDLVEHQKKQALNAVPEIGADTLLGANEDEIIGALVVGNWSAGNWSA